MASITGSFRAAASSTTDCGTPWALNTVTAPSGISESSSTKIAPLRFSVVDDVPVVHDLVAHVDGLAELHERPVDDVDRAHDARAKASRLSQVDFDHRISPPAPPWAPEATNLVYPGQVRKDATAAKPAVAGFVGAGAGQSTAGYADG